MLKGRGKYRKNYIPAHSIHSHYHLLPSIPIRISFHLFPFASHSIHSHSHLILSIPMPISIPSILILSIPIPSISIFPIPSILTPIPSIPIPSPILQARQTRPNSGGVAEGHPRFDKGGIAIIFHFLRVKNFTF